MEHAERCSELLANVMSDAAYKILNMPIKCDVTLTECWYGEDITGKIHERKESYTSHSLDVERMREKSN